MADGGVKDKAGEAITRVKRRVGIENPSAADDDGNVGTVRGALRAFGEGEHDEFIDALKDDVTWEAPKNFPGGESLDGPEEIRDQYIGDIGRTFSSFGFIPEKFLDAEDENAVVVFGTFKGEGVDGDSVEEPGVQVWQFSGTEAEHVRIYTDSAGFPEIITEKVEEEREEERKKKEEEEKKKEEEEAKGESDEDDDSEDSDDSDDSDSDSDDDSDSDAEGKSEEKSESKSDTDSESKTDTDSEAKSDSDSDDDEDTDPDTSGKSYSEGDSPSEKSDEEKSGS
jgi:ketosteroid isomerase-like protein